MQQWCNLREIILTYVDLYLNSRQNISATVFVATHVGTNQVKLSAPLNLVSIAVLGKRLAEMF